MATLRGTRLERTAIAFVFLSGLATYGRAADTAPERPRQVVEIRSGDLAFIVRDNSASPRVLSGIDSLYNVRDAPGFDAFDPHGTGASAGLNFEHIISGHRNPHNAFAPRSGPYRLFHTADGLGARLVRKGADDPWKVSSTLEYQAIEPHAIDFTFRCTCETAELFGPRGYAIFFFANYMNDVADAALHFRGIAAPGGAEQWIAADAPKGPADWNSGGTYRHRDAPPLAYDKDLEFRLNSWSYDRPRYTEPFYFGRAARGMTLLLMFDRAYSADDEIRFSLFKFKLPRHPRPAWDFNYVIHKVVSGKEYGFRGRLVWKKFISADDCREEYRRWSTANRKPRVGTAHGPVSIP
ncbi:MAG TPA: hypothetical protein VHX68_09740 [Planctomycetaceae bacterium]|nr:hypothetical protein [Planctomycetaceae bacterium]